MIYFCRDIRVEINFISTIHPQENRKVDSANKVILEGIKKNMDEPKGLWVE